MVRLPMHHARSPSVIPRCCAAPTCSATARSLSREELTPSVMMCTSYPVSAHSVHKGGYSSLSTGHTFTRPLGTATLTAMCSLSEFRHQGLCQVYSPLTAGARRT